MCEFDDTVLPGRSLSLQTEAFVERIDARLARLEKHQQHAIDSLQKLVRSVWSDGMVEIYGSNYTRLSLPKSDIDCVLVGRSLAEGSPVRALRQVADKMRHESSAKRIEMVDSATIPVLKVVYCPEQTSQEVMLDITCGHSVGHSGVSARDVIYSMQTQMPALRPLVLILKTHLQIHGKDALWSCWLWHSYLHLIRCLNAI